MKSVSAPVAEFLGTFFLCFAGIAAIVGSAPPISSGIGLVGIALAHGLALSVAVNAFGGISGAHFNPAVTIAVLTTGRIGVGRSLVYIACQLAAATLAAGLCAWIFPVEAVNQVHLGIPLPAPWVTLPVLLVTEFVLTFLLVTAIFGTAVDTRGPAVKIGGFGIGLTVAFDILAGGPITGASMNPARSFGPALVHGLWSWHLWYWIAPIAGGIVAAQVYEHLILPRDSRG